MKIFFCLVSILFLSLVRINAQEINLPSADLNPGEYEIGGITVSGASYSDENAIKIVSGLKVGAKLRIPGEDLGNAIRALWKLKLFDNVEITKEKTLGETVFLNIKVTERPRISKHSFSGVKKGSHEDLNKIVERFLPKGTIVTENAKNNVSFGIKKYWKEKGYLDTDVKVKEERDDSLLNSVKLRFDIIRNKKVKIQNITFSGNSSVKSSNFENYLKTQKGDAKYSPHQSLLQRTMRMINKISLNTTIPLDLEMPKLSVIQSGGVRTNI
jgi:outer membrane protein insertion porin family